MAWNDGCDGMRDLMWLDDDTNLVCGPDILTDDNTIR